MLLGAQYMVDGSVAVAKRLKMSEFLIGITIVAIGTSMPELVVSLFGSLDGLGDIAIGNVVGSNIINTFLILGVTALIQPIMIEKSTRRFDIPFNIFVSVLLLLFCFGFKFWAPGDNNAISRLEGLAFLAIFAFYMIYSFRTSSMANSSVQTAPQTGEEVSAKKVKMWLAVVMIVGGLAGLVIGGRLFVRGAVGIAQSLGVSDSIIALTILAIGTSLPELATSVVAALKKKTQLALGNIIGSNIFNITLILGVSATSNPLMINNIAVTDISMIILSSILLFVSIFTFKRNTLDRPEGIIFLLIYIAYITFLIYTA